VPSTTSSPRHRRPGVRCATVADQLVQPACTSSQLLRSALHYAGHVSCTAPAPARSYCTRSTSTSRRVAPRAGRPARRPSSRLETGVRQERHGPQRRRRSEAQASPQEESTTAAIAHAMDSAAFPASVERKSLGPRCRMGRHPRPLLALRTRRERRLRTLARNLTLAIGGGSSRSSPRDAPAWSTASPELKARTDARRSGEHRARADLVTRSDGHRRAHAQSPFPPRHRPQADVGAIGDALPGPSAEATWRVGAGRLRRNVHPPGSPSVGAGRSSTAALPASSRTSLALPVDSAQQSTLGQTTSSSSGVATPDAAIALRHASLRCSPAPGCACSGLLAGTRVATRAHCTPRAASS